MKRRKLLAPVVVALAALLGLSACSSAGTQPAPGQPGTAAETPKELVLGIIGDPSSWHPAQAHVGHQLQPYQAVYDSLLLYSPEGELQPMLATEWEYLDEGKTELQLKLRTDVTFSDGAPFNGEAVKKNLDGFKAANGRQAGQVRAYESTTVVDDSTVVIKLAQSDPAFTYYLSQAAGLMGSPEALDDPNMDAVPVGSGPYVVNTEKSTRAQQWVLEAREGYWNADLQKWDQITMRVLEDVTARVNALTTGQIDATILDAPTRAQAEAAGKTLLAWQVDWTGLLLFDRDGAKVPALADVRVRQAMNYAIDRKALLQNVAMGAGTVTSQVFGPDSDAFLSELEDRYPYDPAKARELLAQAGYADGFDITMPLNPSAEVLANYVRSQLGEVGIRVNLEAVPPADYFSRLGRADFPMAWFNLFQGPSWVAINQLVTTSTLYNPFKTTNPEIEGLVEKVRVASDDAGSSAQDVNRYVTDNAWFVPFYRLDQSYFYDASKVKVEAQTQMAVPSIYNYTPAS